MLALCLQKFFTLKVPLHQISWFKVVWPNECIWAPDTRHKTLHFRSIAEVQKCGLQLHTPPGHVTWVYLEVFGFAWRGVDKM